MKLRIFITTLILSSSFILSSCDKYQNLSGINSDTEGSKVISELENKYNEHFEIMQELNVSGYKEFDVKAISNADSIVFSASTDNDGSNLDDTYVDCLVGKQLSNKLESKLKLDGEIYIWTQPSFGTNNISKDITLEEYEKTQSQYFNVSIFYNPSSSSIDETELYNKLCEAFNYTTTLDCAINIHIDDDESFRVHKSYSEDNSTKYSDFTASDIEYIGIQAGNGKVETDFNQFKETRCGNSDFVEII